MCDSSSKEKDGYCTKLYCLTPKEINFSVRTTRTRNQCLKIGGNKTVRSYQFSGRIKFPIECFSKYKNVIRHYPKTDLMTPKSGSRFVSKHLLVSIPVIYSQIGIGYRFVNSFGASSRFFIIYSIALFSTLHVGCSTYDNLCVNKKLCFIVSSCIIHNTKMRVRTRVCVCI